MSGKQNISIVVPVFNAECSIADLVAEVFAQLGDRLLEIVLVNDGSRDRSEEICQNLAAEDTRIKFISLRKNFSEHNAVMCALNFVSGEYAVIIDDDLQNPPAEIEKLLKEAEKGYDVVYSSFKEKNHSLFRNFLSRVNDRVATILLDKPAELYLSSFKVISKPVIEEILKYRGPFPYVDGLLLRVTDNISSVEVEHRVREKGQSNYNLPRLFNLYLNMFLNFSIAPLRIATSIGVVLFFLSLLFSLVFLIEKIVDPHIPIGWTTIAISILMLGGLQMAFVGILGEYLGKQYLHQNGTPQWVIKSAVNVDPNLTTNAEQRD